MDPKHVLDEELSSLKGRGELDQRDKVNRLRKSIIIVRVVGLPSERGRPLMMSMEM